MTPRPRRALICVALLVGSAQAQAPRALNALLPTAHAARLLDPALDAALATEAARHGPRPATAPRGDSVVADTTSPWRYFPLRVGDAWEYLSFYEDAALRRVVVGDTVFDGRRYFRVAFYRAEGDESPVYEYARLFRFDTLSTEVREPFADGTGREIIAHQLAPCPLDAPLGMTLRCYIGTYAVSGGYDGQLVFGGAWPGTGEDTVVTSYKRYEEEILVRTFRYAADFGLVYREDDEEPSGEALYYARINGTEHGVARYPGVGEVTAEPRPAPGGALALAVRPNPARSWALAKFSLVEAGPARVEAYDGLGRRVLARDLDLLRVGPHEVPLDLAVLPAGVYVIRLVTGSKGETATRPLVVFR